MLISNKARSGFSTKTVEENVINVSADQSKHIWDIYIRSNSTSDLMEATVVEQPTPVQAAYEFLKTVPPGSKVVFGKSDRDVDDTRFDRLSEWAHENNLDVQIEVIDTPVFGRDISGTLMRRFLADGDRKSFCNNIPATSVDDQDRVWKVFHSDDTLNEDVISERVIKELNIDLDDVFDTVFKGLKKNADNYSVSNQETIK